MTEFEKLAVALVKKLLPEFDKLEFKARVSETSYSIEFFVWIGEERKQNYELADNGSIDELKMDALFSDFAVAVRKLADFRKGELNKYVVTIENYN